MDSINPTNPPQEREMTPTEMMFLVSAYFYIEASEVAQQALIEKNPAFIVLKQENDPTIQAGIADTEADREVVGEHAKSYYESLPGPEDATGKPIKRTP